MKKVLLSLVLSALLLSVTACGKGEVHTDSVTSDWYIPSAPDYTIDVKKPHGFTDLPIGMEHDYSNIVAYAQQSEYPADEAVVEYHIRNNNKGKGFWVYNGCLVQYYNGREWTTLPWKGSGELDETGSQYGFNYGTNEQGCVEVNTQLDLNKLLAVGVKPGKYRIVNFLADSSLYIEFEVI